MKRILLLNYEFPPLGGGGGVATKALAEGFVKLGYEVDYVTSWFKGLKEFEVVNGVNIHRVRVIGRKELPTATMVSVVSFPFMAYGKAAELCRKYLYDFINTQFAVPTGPLGVWISKKFKIKNILSLHGGDVYDPTKKNSPHRKWYFRAVVRWVLRNSDVVTAQSSNTIANTRKYYGYDKEIRLIPLPYEPVFFETKTRAELGLREDGFYTVSIGRLVARKGFDFLLRSLAKTGNEKIRSIIIGSGPEHDALESLARRMGISERVCFMSGLTDAQKFQYLSAADVYVLSSVHEGFGIVLQEAMQMGLPIIATDNGGQIDLVKEGENGLLVKYGDEDGLARAILRVSEDGGFREMCSKNNRIVSKRFDVRSICEEYLKSV